MASEHLKQAVIFDGDDTLWRTEVLYDQARKSVRKIVARHGIDPIAWEKRQREIDVANVATYGFSPSRFPTSSLQAFRELRPWSGGLSDDAVDGEIVDAASSVFRKNAKLMPHVESVLRSLRNRDVQMALLTKGDPSVQARRIDSSGLARFFDLIEVVPEKTTDIFSGIVAKLNVNPSQVWTVGNSLRSDILPAVSLGIKGIWIEAPVWEYESRGESLPIDSVFQRRDIMDILQLVP